MKYDSDVLAGDWRKATSKTIPVVQLQRGMVVEDGDGRFAGAVLLWTRTEVTLEDRHGRTRVFPLTAAGFLLDGRAVTLAAPAEAKAPMARGRTASGSFAVPEAPARVAAPSRIWVEGIHDAVLVERVWGADLRVEGVVVEPLDGIDELADAVAHFGPTATSRLGVLVDHLVPGSKESRIVAGVHSPHVLINGHPYVDVWQAVKPAAIGIRAWPQVPKGTPWKEGVCAALGVADPREMWRQVLAGVRSYADIEMPLLRSVEELIDFVTVPADPHP